MNEFGSDWSRQKLLCYDVRAAVINALGYLELVQDETADESAAKKALKGAHQTIRDAGRKAEELFQEIWKAGNT